MKKLNLLLLAGIAITFVNCGTEPTFEPDKPGEDGIYIIEAENMELTSCEIVEIDTVSNKKAVLLGDPYNIDSTSNPGTYDTLSGGGAKGKAKIKLSKGSYFISAKAFAPHVDSDGFYLVGNETPHRTHVNKTNQFRYVAKTMTFTAEYDGEHTIHFASNWEGKLPGEAGMTIDKIEIISVSPLDKATKAQDKWANP